MSLRSHLDLFLSVYFDCVLIELFFVEENRLDWKDFEFVKQTIGHRNLDTTSAYVNQLSDQERQKRIDQLK